MRTRIPQGTPVPTALLMLSLLPCSFAACGGEEGRAGGTLAAQQATMEKWVSPSATVVLYKPAGWQAEEGEAGGGYQIAVRSGDRTLEATMAYGPSATGNDVVALTRSFLESLGQESPDLAVTGAFQAPDGSRLAVEGTYTDRGGRKAFRLWVDARADTFTMTRISAPEARIEGEKARLLSILANVRVLKGSTPPSVTEPLIAHRLRDGSASFQMPRTWQVQEFGAGGFVAADPAGSPSFIVAIAEIIDPRLGINPPGAVVAPYQPPHQALALLASAARIASGFQFLWVNPRRDIDALIAQASPAPAAAEEFIYTFTDAQGRPGKAYTFGISFGSQTGAVWRLWHMTVGAPADRFDALVPAFITMLQSYRIDEAYARAYVQRGMQNLRRLQQETARMTARNADEIRTMMQAAYDERQASQDYIDYQRTDYIRGQQDWISEMEGGAVYHADSWGTKNTVTGEFWQGAPYDYVNFTGQNPKYNEQMTPIDSRRLWERHVR